VASMRNRFGARWYPVFAWVYTCCWVAALVFVWISYGRMPLWLRIASGVILTLTTPAGGDLFLIGQLWRRPQDGTSGDDGSV
jgi:hypothetical protein